MHQPAEQEPVLVKAAVRGQAPALVEVLELEAPVAEAWALLVWALLVWALLVWALLVWALLVWALRA